MNDEVKEEVNRSLASISAARREEKKADYTEHTLYFVHGTWYQRNNE
jgi:hypothetical protein